MFVAALKHLISLPYITTIPHMLLKSRIKELIQRCFSQKNREQRYQYLVIGREKSYFEQKVKKGGVVIPCQLPVQSVPITT
jgi:hypothetical protein